MDFFSKYIQRSSSIKHFNSFQNYLQKTSDSGKEAISAALAASANLMQIGFQASMGAVAPLSVASQAIYVNAGLQSAEVVAPTITKPFISKAIIGVKAALTFAIYHPLSAMVIGAVTGIVLYPQSSKDAARNIGHCAYKACETAFNATMATKEASIGAALYAKETYDGLNDYFDRQQGYGDEKSYKMDFKLVDIDVSGETYTLMDGAAAAA